MCIAYAQQDTAKTTEKMQFDSVFVMQKSPWGAVLRSAVLPGWGQIYNQSYWKAPVIWGLTAYLVGYWISNNKDYKTNRDFYSENKDSKIVDYRLINRALTFREFYRDQRDMFAIYMGLTYILTLVDAYVDAHMFDFTVKEDFFTKSPYLKMSFKYGF